MMGRQIEFVREFQKFNELSQATVRQRRAAEIPAQVRPRLGDWRLICWNVRLSSSPEQRQAE